MSDQDTDKQNLLGTSVRKEEEKPKTVLSTLCIMIVVTLIVAIPASLLFAYYVYAKYNSTSITTASGDDAKILEQKAQSCAIPPITPFDIELPQQTSTVLLKNAQILLENGTPQRCHLLLANTKISQIIAITETNLPVAAQTFDLQFRFVSPGLVDMHSHVGVHSFPEVNANLDVNERTAPITPMLQAADAFNAEDIGIALILQGGVTTSQVMPGSSNIFGGQTIFIKHRANANRVAQMRIDNAPRGIKMAMGENPKGAYGPDNEMPYSRMGTAWLMRETFDKAKRMAQAQLEHDCKTGPMPYDEELEPLVYMFKNNSRFVINVHCYEVEDIEALLRVTKEFNVKITAIHHALEAYKVADTLFKNNITVALFPDKFGAKMETHESSVQGPRILFEHGVPVAIKSDHPVLHARYLIYQAAKAFFFGLPLPQSLASVTSVPADTIMLGDRIGRIKLGYDADIVVWDRHPLQLGAKADKIFVDGNLLVDNKLPIKSNTLTAIQNMQRDSILTGCNQQRRVLPYYAISDVQLFYRGRFVEGSIVVRNGNITCIGDCDYPDNVPEISLEPEEAGIVTPFLIDSVSQLGMVEINRETITNDGSATGKYRTISTDVFAADGIRLQTRTLEAAYKGGVAAAISMPSSTSALIAGQGVAFVTDYRGVTVHDQIIQSPTGLFVNLGQDVKRNIGSVSAQMAQLHNLLVEAKQTRSGIFAALFNKQTPLVVTVHEMDYMVQLLQWKRELQFDLILVGAADAHLIANDLASANVSVVLTPFKPGYVAKEAWRTVKAVADDFGVSKLYAAGVRIGVATGFAHYGRELRWFAGLVTESMPRNEAIKTITSNIYNMFGIPSLELQVGMPARFVLFDGDPLSFEGKVKMIANGQVLDCDLRQF